MEEYNKILSNYVKAILDGKAGLLDNKDFPQEYLPLVNNLVTLNDDIKNATMITQEIIKGKFVSDDISANNELIKNIIQIQKIFNHLNDQTQQIISGNYSDNCNNDIVDAFNNVILELKKRTSALENERNLFIQFTESAKERIIVLDEKNGKLLFGNKMARDFYRKNVEYIDSATDLNRQSNCSSINPYSQWSHKVKIKDELGKETAQYYQVHSIYIIWENKGAIAHMFADETEIRKIRDLALKDQLTGTYNRHFAMSYLNNLIDENKSFALAFVDIDYLKYCNDEFGHHAGDMYLIQVANLLKSINDKCIVCRSGGDEFLVILIDTNKEEMEQLLLQANKQLSKEKFNSNSSIHKCFSYGIETKDNNDLSLQEILSRADELMYKNKLANKKRNHLNIKDDRL